MRSAVARRERVDGGRDVIHWNPRFSQLRGHYAFHAHACTPETPREKGSVEGAVRYLKTGFWPARRFAELAELDDVYAAWRDRVALPRQHATGRHIVADRLAHEREQLRPLPPGGFDAAGRRSSRVPADGYLKFGRCFYRAPEALVQRRVELRWDRDRVWIEHHGHQVADYRRSYEHGTWQPAPRLRPEPPPVAAAASAAGPAGHPAGARRLRRALRMRPQKTTSPVGERLPYLLSKLKTPRVLERLEQTAATAREEGWPYEQFLEVLLEAEVFARDASGSRNRIRHAAFPAHKTLEDFDFTAQPAAEKPLILHLAQLAWASEHMNVCFFGPPGTGKTHLAIALAIKACQAERVSAKCRAVGARAVRLHRDGAILREMGHLSRRGAGKGSRWVPELRVLDRRLHPPLLRQALPVRRH